MTINHLRGVYERASIRYFFSDVDAEIAFCTGKFGFKLKQKVNPAFAYVSKDDLALWLSGPQSSAARPMPDGRRPEAGGWNPSGHLARSAALDVSNVAITKAAIRTQGVRLRVSTGFGVAGALSRNELEAAKGLQAAMEIMLRNQGRTIT